MKISLQRNPLRLTDENNKVKALSQTKFKMSDFKKKKHMTPTIGGRIRRDSPEFHFTSEKVRMFYVATAGRRQRHQIKVASQMLKFARRTLSALFVTGHDVKRNQYNDKKIRRTL